MQQQGCSSRSDRMFHDPSTGHNPFRPVSLFLSPRTLPYRGRPGQVRSWGLGETSPRTCGFWTGNRGSPNAGRLLEYGNFRAVDLSLSRRRNCSPEVRRLDCSMLDWRFQRSFPVIVPVIVPVLVLVLVSPKILPHGTPWLRGSIRQASWASAKCKS